MLERFCQAHKLTYAKQAEGTDDLDGVIEYWKPGMSRPQSCFADQAGVPAITLDDLRKARARYADLASVIRSLREVVLKVPPLVIVETLGVKTLHKRSGVRVAKDRKPAASLRKSAPKGE
jgi:hypothetical protein